MRTRVQNAEGQDFVWPYFFLNDDADDLNKGFLLLLFSLGLYVPGLGRICLETKPPIMTKDLGERTNKSGALL